MNPRWRCFVKGISVTHVIVTLLPASVRDVRKIAHLDETEVEEEEEEDADHRNDEDDYYRPEDLSTTPCCQSRPDDCLTSEHQQSSLQINDSRSGNVSPIQRARANTLASQTSNAESCPARYVVASSLSDKPTQYEDNNTDDDEDDERIVIDFDNNNENDGSSEADNSSRSSSNSRNGGLVIPLYVYDCSLALLVDALVEKLDKPRFKDIFCDHTFRLPELYQEYYINLKSMDGGSSATKPSSPEPKSEDSDNVISGKSFFFLSI